MTAPAAELYVYYRVPASQAPAALAAVRDCQQQLCAAHPGLSARLLRRCDAGAPVEFDAEAQQTWMETYHCQPGGVDAALAAAIEAQAVQLQRFINGARHVETFTPCA